MNENGLPSGGIDGSLFIDNVNKQPRDLFLEHAGRFVAWSLDGTRLIASAASREELDKQLQSAGVPFDLVVHDYIDPI